MQQFKATQQKIELKQIIEPCNEDGGFQVYSDCNRFKQVLINLVSNALKFTDEQDKITICCEIQIQGDSEYLIASVEDTGIGISKEDQEKMF